MASYYCGLKINTLAASTFAFATICLSRLLHGLSSRNEKKHLSNRIIFK